jgi:membrane protein required for colicin V production
MWLDIVFLLVLVFALLKGFSQGLILGIFSLIAIIAGLAAALKLSAVVATYLEKSGKITQSWLPLLSFIIVFIIVVILVRLAAAAIRKTFQLAMLGWLDRLGGMIFFAAIYMVVFSVVLFFAVQMKWIDAQTIQSSRTYTFIQPWGPKAIDGIGSIIPIFKNLFGELEHFFETVSHHLT